MGGWRRSVVPANHIDRQHLHLDTSHFRVITAVRFRKTALAIPTRESTVVSCRTFSFLQTLYRPRWPVNCSPFYSARNARIASAVLATAIPSVRLSVCPSGYDKFASAREIGLFRVVRRLDDGHHYDVLGPPSTSDDGGQYISIGEANSGYTADPTLQSEDAANDGANDEIDVSEPASSEPPDPTYIHPF